ncbi:ASPIC and UnbV [Stieleria neptunia]|uniref:ASPIC and UnbV n=1 Tax=Stieleria neptunia TaxID=2527979 RepID=A0A518HXX6_9BACT|nr:FG-GAP-like repeat-containing protein [Stieleria neptunia]QDV45702.1 ASPIC and UnbV [Stieleria neptunia]
MKSQRSLALGALLAIAVGCTESRQPPAVEVVARDPQNDSVDAALRESRIEDAQRLARDALIVSPDDPGVLTAAARATAAAGDRREAAELLARATRAAGFNPASRVEMAVRAFLEVGEAYPAIELLSQAVEAEPDRHALRRMLFGLLGEVGRTDLMQEHYEAIIRQRTFDVPVLLTCTDTSQRLFTAEAIEALIERNPNDHRLRLGLAQSMRDGRQFSAAESVLREIIRHHGDFAPAHAMLGRMPGIQQASDEAFEDWLTAALPHCRDQADFWIALGDRHFHLDDFSAALSCYAEAARLGPNMAVAWTQISQSIRQLQSRADPGKVLDEDAAEQIIQRADRRARHLFDLRMHLQRFGGSGERSQRAAADVARALSRLGRDWEAEAWSAIATTLPGETDPSLDALRRSIVADLRQNRAWQSLPDWDPLDEIAGNPVTDIDRTIEPVPSSNHRGLLGSAVPLRYVDETRSRRLVLPAIEYHDIASGLVHSMGSGGGTLDFDLDGRSDLTFSASGETPTPNSSRTSMLRNLDGQFADVTVACGCSSQNFGQGVAIGDYNEDGFADIFFANVGRNRLLRNNGDGTFSDDTRSLHTTAHQWTTSGAFVDLDRDGITDLIAVNYCDLTSDVDQPCRTDEGPAPCHPAKFPADRDQVWLGDGRGGFEPSFVDPLKRISPGRGLGILAGQLTDGSQSAFIANDMSANHLLEINPGGLAELAVPRGIAVDGQSLAQASMGIACGDFDGDSDLDLYVTGFAREYNIYYEQQAAGLWVDSTARQKLIEPTLMTVGFGAQAIDMDADGIDELAITNGHIGDFGPDQPPLEQPFQLMRRSTNGIFQPVELSDQSPYLATNHIGRALWKIDVDADLADDLIVTHQDAPPVLLANRTETDNRRIGIRCIGTASARDAIGAIVQFIAEGRRRRVWLLSGDGYMGSNERILKAGIGSSERVEDVTVTWPSGSVESFGGLDAGQTHLLIEGSAESFAAD